jgi:multisubunit Na+/H+ antiporter MnhC subunit
MDKDVIKNLAVNGAAIGMSFTELEQALRLTALIIGLAYTIYNFNVAYKKNEGK